MRFEDSNDFSGSQLDFVPRDRRSQTSRIGVAFSFITLLLCLIGLVPDFGGAIYGHLILAIALAALGIYVVINAQRLLDLIMSTEYLNLMFSQGLALGSNFCLFVKRDGTIVYANDGLRQLFGPTGESNALETVFERGGVAAPDRERLMGAIYSDTHDKLIFPITSAGEVKQFVLTVEPLPRPRGYVMIRGREFKGERSGIQMMPDMLRSTSPDKLDHLLSETPVGHYATDVHGRFEYVNPAFERALAYDSGEMVASRLTLTQVLYKLGDRMISNDYSIGDFAGEATLQGKGGFTMNYTLYQRAMRDENGKTTGASGSIIASTMLNQDSE